jgi:hypothetical protein
MKRRLAASPTPMPITACCRWRSCSCFSGLIFFAGTYLNRYSGHFHGNIFDERQLPTTGQVVAVKIDPVVLGKKQYALACITCHMPNGQGLPGVYPPLAGSEWVMVARNA